MYCLYGQHCDHCIHQPPRRSTLLSHVATPPPSPPLELKGSKVASRRSYLRWAQSCSQWALTSARPSVRMVTPPWDGPADWETLRQRSGRPICLPNTSHYQLFFYLSEGTLGTDALELSWPLGLRKYEFPPVSFLAQTLCSQGGWGAGPLSGAILAQSDLFPRTNAPRNSPSLANSSEEGSPFLEIGHPMAPASRLVESPCVVPGWDMDVLSGLSPAVVNTITSARAPSTRHANRLKWNLFIDWCSSRREDPRKCPIRVVLSFLQDRLSLYPQICRYRRTERCSRW